MWNLNSCFYICEILTKSHKIIQYLGMLPLYYSCICIYLNIFKYLFIKNILRLTEYLKNINNKDKHLCINSVIDQ